MSPRFAAPSLIELATGLLEQRGAPPANASLVARSLVEADAAGIFSHGLLRLPLYLRAVTSGGIDPTSEPEVIRQHGAVTVLDARAAFGQVAMQRAVDLAAGTAREHGMATVAVQGSSHFGAGRFWIEQLTDQGIAGILASTTGPVAAAYGGSVPVLGTNPFTIGLPSAGEGPLVADLATTAGAYGKVVAARDAGEPIPEDWAVDAAGRPTTDPSAVLDGGALLPFGGHKGSGIAVLLEALSAALTSASFAMNTVDIWQDPSSRMNTGHLLIALDLAAFGDPATIRGRVAALQESVRASHPEREVLSPGDLEHRRRRQAGAGVAVPEATVAELRELAAAASLPFPDPVPEHEPAAASAASEGSRP
ncbi:Ldh family oxidoreductase [Brachybacterium sp. J144]|uniref:Ldh family oxidoreductase n=1 Tax=Brachybacterium sp. J144 TaxID=3116487 RepID=UPI002E791729|nr:Ldh family oxidoreductase [Brachybacterium sp. J144]MEE1650281.1 Ldh family oxidoreductase [Brachybacterium sp. J144]